MQTSNSTGAGVHLGVVVGGGTWNTTYLLITNSNTDSKQTSKRNPPYLLKAAAGLEQAAIRLGRNLIERWSSGSSLNIPGWPESSTYEYREGDSCSLLSSGYWLVCTERRENKSTSRENFNPVWYAILVFNGLEHKLGPDTNCLCSEAIQVQK